VAMMVKVGVGSCFLYGRIHMQENRRVEWDLLVWWVWDKI